MALSVWLHRAALLAAALLGFGSASSVLFAVLFMLLTLTPPFVHSPGASNRQVLPCCHRPPSRPDPSRTRTRHLLPAFKPLQPWLVLVAFAWSVTLCVVLAVRAALSTVDADVWDDVGAVAVPSVSAGFQFVAPVVAVAVTAFVVLVMQSSRVQAWWRSGRDTPPGRGHAGERDRSRSRCGVVPARLTQLGALFALCGVVTIQPSVTSGVVLLLYVGGAWMWTSMRTSEVSSTATVVLGSALVVNAASLLAMYVTGETLSQLSSRFVIVVTIIDAR